MSKKIFCLLLLLIMPVMVLFGCTKINGTGVIVEKTCYMTTIMIKSGNVFVPVTTWHYLFFIEHNGEIIEVCVDSGDYYNYEIGNEYTFETMR